MRGRPPSRRPIREVAAVAVVATREVFEPALSVFGPFAVESYGKSGIVGLGGE